MSERLRARIAAKEEELTELCRALVRIPSENPPGRDYRAVCELVGERLRQLGFEVVYARAEGALADSDRHPRWNVIARFASGRSGPTVHFNSHVDVVAPGEGWTRDPFGGEVAHGRLYGRGSCDMKGGLAASIAAAEALVEEGLVPSGALEV